MRRRVADASSQTLKRTPLHDRHVAASARLIPFAGWEMPVQYADGIRAEHVAVRTAAGVFDVSHMGQIETTGPQAGALLQRLISNAGRIVLLDHWGGDTEDLADLNLRGALAAAAFFLPRRIRRRLRVIGR